MNERPAGETRRAFSRKAFPPARDWVLLAVFLLFCFHHRLVPGLVAGLIVHILLQRATGLLHGPMLSHGAAKWVAAGVSDWLRVHATDLRQAGGAAGAAPGGRAGR